MSIGRKIFLSYSALIILMGLLLLGGMFLGMNQLIRHLAETTQGPVLDAVSREIETAYSPTDGWGNLDSGLPADMTLNGSYLIKDDKSRSAAFGGDMNMSLVERFGLKKELVTRDGKGWTLYYMNSAVYFVGLFRYAFRDALILFLGLAMIVFVMLSIVVSYFMAKHLTSPLRGMIPVIDAFAKGNLRAKVPVASSDEFGRIGAALNNMSAELEQSLQIRRNMTADVAHELRTPLSILSGKLEYLQQRGQPIAPEELLPLQDELIRLQRMVHDLRELSQAEAGQLPLHPENVNLHGLLERIVDKVSFEAEERGVAVHLEPSPENIYAMIDKNRMTQVLLNLIMNGIRYTPSGGEVRIHADASEHQVLITVTDNGIGIEPEHLPFLFQRFYRTDRARDRDSGGTGLGLAIAAEYVRAHGGDITAESEKNRGTSFYVRIPPLPDPLP